MIKIEAYICEFCKMAGRKQRPVSTRKVMEEHEKKCWFNPVVRACKSCKNYDSELSEEGFYEDCKKGIDLEVECETSIETETFRSALEKRENIPGFVLASAIKRNCDSWELNERFLKK